LRGSHDEEGLAKWSLVANGVARCTPFWEGMLFVPTDMAITRVDTDAASARTTTRTVPKIGPRIRRTIQTCNSPNWKLISTRPYILLHVS
jgi:hypothetical protein